MVNSPTIVWFRRDLRLHDNAALAAAAAQGPVVPLFILDPVIDAQLGAAARLRLEASLTSLQADLAKAGAPLVLRRGDALDVLRALIRETGAARVTWTRLTDGPSIERDTKVKAALKADGVEAESFGGFTLLDPWKVKGGSGDPYRVFTPFSKAVLKMDVPSPVATPGALAPVAEPPRSDDLQDWMLAKPMGPAAAALAGQFRAGEAAARERLDDWMADHGARYAEDRNRLDRPEACTNLSDFLAYGEISPRAVWHVMDRANGVAGVEAARRQLIWRDFAHMLLFHDPEMETLNWRREWAAFPWKNDPNSEAAERWRRGETGCDVVDAAMRELWVTGRMHNRARMLVASYLTKHLLTDWRIGEAHFRETLIDWDPANNAMGWQWVAGCGPDASPFFRIFNPETQAEKFDPNGGYRRRWLSGVGAETFQAMRPKSHQTASDRRPDPLVDLKYGRIRALEAWKEMRDKDDAVTA